MPLIPVFLNNELYSFVVALAYIFIATTFAINHALNDRGVRREKLVTSIGCLFFMIVFFVTQNVIVGEFLSRFFDTTYLVYGFYFLPLLLGILAYLAVRFKSYRIRVATNQLFLLSVFALILSLFFFIENTVAVLLNLFLVFFMIIISHMIIESVTEEIRIREQVEELANNLVSASQSAKKLNIKLEELSLQKTEFVSLATHQLRGPLASINGYMSMMLDGDFGSIDGTLKEAVISVFKNSQSLTGIVNDYLNISRIELGKMTYNLLIVDLNEVVQEIVTEIVPILACTKNNLSLLCSFDKSEIYKVRADMGKIKQALSNLIDNSIKYTNTGHITINLEKKEGKVVFSVSDTGVGISSEVMPNLFNRFTRAPDASKSNILGTGLGLFVVKKLVEAQNGKVWAESEGEGKGSCFYVEFTEEKGIL